MKALGKGSIASIIEVGLTIAWIILWVAFGLWALAMLGYGVFMALVTGGMIDPASIPNESNLRIEVPGVDGNAFENLRWTHWQIFIIGFLTAGVVIGGSLVIISRLRRLFDSFRSGDPFRRENAQHLRVIWITMIVIELARYVLTATIVGLALAFGASQGVALRQVELTVDFTTWGSILILIVFAEVFREGARLKEEQELTI
jgi:hypothetical protein